MSNSFEEIYQMAKEWTIEAGERLRVSLKEALQVEYKTSAADIVTQKDREIEQFFIDKIKQKYPAHYILGEEGMAAEHNFHPPSETVWIIDPIDGTTNFVHQKQNFCISVAIYEQGKPKVGIIYDPIRGECFHAFHEHGAYLNDQKLEALSSTHVEEAVIGLNGLWLTPNIRFDHLKLQALVRHVRGTRSVGSAALEMAYVASGRLDGYITLRLSPWDFAAGLVLLHEVGARMSTIENQEIDVYSKTSIFVAKPELHEQIIQQYILTEDIPSSSEQV